MLSAGIDAADSGIDGRLWFTRGHMDRMGDVDLQPDSLNLRQHPRRIAGTAALVSLLLLGACGKEVPKLAPAPLEVSIITVKPRNVDVSREYIAQTQSSQAVNIQVRVSGFLDKRVYCMRWSIWGRHRTRRWTSPLC